MGFGTMVPKSVTLNDLELRNGRYFAFFLPMAAFDQLRKNGN